MINNGFKRIKEDISGITGGAQEMTLVDTILLGLVMLLGEEGKDYIVLERELEEWLIVGYLRRN